MRSVWLFLILPLPMGGELFAADVPLRKFFNPAAGLFRLPAVESGEFARFGPDDQLIARGFRPDDYFVPPLFKDSIPQAMNKRTLLYAGFAYATRFSEKKRFWRLASRRKTVRDLVPWVEHLPLDSPAAFTKRYRKLIKGMRVDRDPNQMLLALRHSERRFREWWVAEFVARVKSARRSDQRFVMARLRSMSRHGVAAVREVARELLAKFAAPIALPARVEGPEVDFYGLRTKDRRVLFCIDVSTSMDFPMDGHRGKREARRVRTVREFARTIGALSEQTEFNVLFFSRRVRSLWPRLRAGNAVNRAAALEAVRTAGTEGGTNMWAALDASFRSGADTVYLLSDGEPSVGHFLDPTLILHEARARNLDGRVRIHSIGLSRDQNVELMFNLARASGGRYFADR